MPSCPGHIIGGIIPPGGIFKNPPHSAVVLKKEEKEKKNKQLTSTVWERKNWSQAKPYFSFAGLPIDWQRGGPVSSDSMLSHVKGALLPLFSTEDANCLRLVCREFLEDVTSHQWEDKDTVIRGSLEKWRRCFPRARAALVEQYHEEYNPSGRRHNPSDRRMLITDHDCVHFAGVLHLNIKFCTSITDAAFIHLQSIKSLNMSRSRTQPLFTYRAFSSSKWGDSSRSRTPPLYTYKAFSPSI